VQTVGPCPSHSGEVGIDPAEPRYPVEDRLEACFWLAMIDASAVEHQHRSAGPVLHVVDRDLARSPLHSGKPSDAWEEVKTASSTRQAPGGGAGWEP
jgi:hypothetical protein